MNPTDSLSRCPWGEAPEDMRDYHDREWGVPLHHDPLLFEFMVLESSQSGLSWLTILRRREGYRRAFAGFDPRRVAAYGPEDLERLLADPGVIRHRGKLEAAVHNAGRVLEVQQEFGSLANYLWGFVDGVPVRGAWSSQKQVPGSTDLSDRIARDLKRRGFRFLGSTTVYAFLQAAGIVNDHLVSCHRFDQV